MILPTHIIAPWSFRRRSKFHVFPNSDFNPTNLPQKQTGEQTSHKSNITMVQFKPHRSSQSAKPKITSARPSVKFDSRARPPSFNRLDSLLQAIGTRRRYLRRGSKTPAMLRIKLQQEAVGPSLSTLDVFRFDTLTKPQEKLQRRESSVLVDAMKGATIHDDEPGLISTDDPKGDYSDHLLRCALNEALKQSDRHKK